MTPVRGHTDSDVGTSLVELVIVVAIMGIVLPLAYLMLNSVSSMSSQVQARTVATEETRAAVEVMTRELRQGQEIVDAAGAFYEGTARRCSFYADVSHDGVPERVTYYVDGRSLLRVQASSTTSVPPYAFGADGTARVLVEGLDPAWSGAIFTYYDNSTPAATVASNETERVSAVNVRVRNGAIVANKTVYADYSTWVKIRAVHNTIN